MDSFVITADPTVSDFWGWIIPVLLLLIGIGAFIYRARLPKDEGRMRRETFELVGGLAFFFAVFSVWPVVSFFGSIQESNRTESIEAALLDLGFEQVFTDDDSYTLIKDNDSETYLTIRDGNTIAFHKITD